MNDPQYMTSAGPSRMLLIEDNQADIDLVRETFATGSIPLSIDVATNGEDAIDFLNRRGVHAKARRPQLILLDLNLPGIDGRQVLAEIKANHQLRRIPVVVLSSSSARQDVVTSYESGASCYIAKPVDLASYRAMVREVEAFWFTLVSLPPLNGNHTPN
jgi:chemotaxis family two-component system response regulator Rcp1